MADPKRPGSYAQAYRDAVDQLAHIRDASAVDHIERIIEHAARTAMRSPSSSGCSS